MKKIILLSFTLYISCITHLLSDESSLSNEPIGGMYFSYYENKGEVATLTFNIAEGNITQIELYIKYKDKGFKEATITCKSTYLGTRSDFPPINITCNKMGLRQYLIGHINEIKLKKRSKKGIIADLDIMRIALKESFYEQLKKDPTHTIKDHFKFTKEKIIIKKEEELVKAQKEAKLRAEQEAKAKAEKVRAEKKAREKREREAKLKAEREAKLRAEQEAKARAEKAKADKEAKAKAEREAKLRAEKEAEARAEKAKADIKAKARAKQEAKLELEIAEWNKKDKIKLFLYDIENFIKTYPNRLDNKKLIKLLRPVKDLDKNKLLATSDNLYLINNLNEFLMSNSDFYNFRQKSITDRENARILALENEMRAKKEAREKRERDAKLKAEREAKLKKLREAKEKEEKEFIINFIELNINIVLKFINEFINNDPLNDKSYDLLILEEKYNEKLEIHKDNLNANDIQNLLNSIKNLSLYQNYQSYLNKYIEENVDYNIKLERFNLIEKEKEEKLLAIENEIKAKQEAKARAEKAKAEKEAKDRAEREAKDRAEREAKARAEKAKTDKKAKDRAEREAKLRAEREAAANAIVKRKAKINENVSIAYGTQQKFMYDLVQDTIFNTKGKSQAIRKRMWIKASKELCNSTIFDAYGIKKDWIGKLIGVSMDDKGEVAITISIENDNRLSDGKIPDSLIDYILNIDLGPLNWLGRAKNGPLIKFSGSFRRGNISESECLDAGLTASPELTDESFAFDIKQLELY